MYTYQLQGILTMQEYSVTSKAETWRDWPSQGTMRPLETLIMVMHAVLIRGPQNHLNYIHSQASCQGDAEAMYNLQFYTMIF